MKGIEFMDFGFSPVEKTSKGTQRIINPEINKKIIIHGIRLIKNEDNKHIQKILRIQK